MNKELEIELLEAFPNFTLKTRSERVISLERIVEKKSTNTTLFYYISVGLNSPGFKQVKYNLTASVYIDTSGCHEYTLAKNNRSELPYSDAPAKVIEQLQVLLTSTKNSMTQQVSNILNILEE